jgi:hypothetical protein
VTSYEYRFRFKGEEGKTFKVTKRAPAAGVAHRGISYRGVVHELSANPGKPTFRTVEVGAERIRLAYTFKEPVGVYAGNGVAKTWHGFFSMAVREGFLILDGRNLTPLEVRSGELSEAFSDYVEVGKGRYAPLSIRVSQGRMRFDWRFRVYEPGLWLFERTGDGVAAVVDQVKVNGAEARPFARE